MPEPVSSKNAGQHLAPEACPQDSSDPTVATCAPQSGTAPDARVIELDPLIIHAEPGAQALVKQYTENTGPGAPVCRVEEGSLQLTCSGALLAAAGTLVATPTGVGLVIGTLGTFRMAMDCGGAFRQYSDCLERSAIRQEAQSRCEADGGVALQGFAENELICWVRP